MNITAAASLLMYRNSTDRLLSQRHIHDRQGSRKEEEIEQQSRRDGATKQI